MLGLHLLMLSQESIPRQKASVPMNFFLSSSLSVVSYLESIASYIVFSFIVVFRRKLSPALLL